MKSRILPLIITILCMFHTPAPAHAAGSEWTSADYMKARLIAAQGSEGKTELALQIQMDAGWHSYWRSPGEAGLPFRFDWDGTQNAENFEISWPLPKRFIEAELKTFGYEGNVIFPIHFTKPNKNDASKLVLSLNGMVCKDICIPQHFLLQLDLLNKDVGTANNALIEFGKRKTPHIGDTETLEISSVIAGPDALVVNAIAKNGFENLDLFTELPDQMLLGDIAVQIDKTDTTRAIIKILAPEDVKNLNAALAGKTITLTLVNGREAIEKKIKL